MKNFFGKDSPKGAVVSKTPYLDAKRIWNVHTGTAIAQQRLWQVLALISLLVALAAVGGIIHIGSQSRFVPYVVEVDKLGHVRAVAPAQRAGKADERVITALVARFIEDLRTVSPDVALQRRSIVRVYSMLKATSPGGTKANAFYQNPAMNPLTRAESETVSIQINSVLPQTERSWQVDWTERTYDRKGSPIGAPVNMRALLDVDQINPTAETTEQQMRDNPLGIYVTDFNWSKPL